MMLLTQSPGSRRLGFEECIKDYETCNNIVGIMGTKCFQRAGAESGLLFAQKLHWSIYVMSDKLHSIWLSRLLPPKAHAFLNQLVSKVLPCLAFCLQVRWYNFYPWWIPCSVAHSKLQRHQVEQGLHGAGRCMHAQDPVNLYASVSLVVKGSIFPSFTLF